MQNNVPSPKKLLQLQVYGRPAAALLFRAGDIVLHVVRSFVLSTNHVSLGFKSTMFPSLGFWTGFLSQSCTGVISCSPLFPSFVSMRGAVFLFLFTSVTFGIRRVTLRLTRRRRWWWWRRWRGRGWWVRLDTSGFIYVYSVCYLSYFRSFFL